MIVYGIFCPLTGDLRYVGRTTNLEQRMAAHRAGRSRVGRWLRALGAQAEARVLAEPVALADDEPFDDAWSVNWARRRAWLELERTVIGQHGRDPLLNERGHGPSKELLCSLCRKPGHDRRFCARTARVGATCNDGPRGEA